MNLEPIKNSICVLYRVTPEDELRPFATGFFFMEDNLVATARHVMEDLENAREPYGLIVRPSQSRDGSLVEECAYHTEQDIALLKLVRRFPVRPLGPCSQANSGFVFIGFDPPTASIVVRPVPKFRTPVPWKGKHSITYLFEWDDCINRGSSGRPLIGSDGGVAGLLSGVPHRVNCSSDEIPPPSTARAVFIGPLLDLYARLKTNPDSIARVHVPFTD